MSVNYNDGMMKPTEVRLRDIKQTCVLSGYPLDRVMLRIETDEGMFIECSVGCAELIYAVLTINPKALSERQARPS